MKRETKKTLAPRLRFPEFRKEPAWASIPLRECLDYEQPTPYLVSETNYSPSFKTPVLTAGKTFILGYTDEQHGIFTEGLPVIIFDDFTTATQFVDFPFKAKSSAMKILTAKADADIRFMYEALQLVPFEVGAHERHWISTFAPMQIPVPSPAEQRKIAACLGSLDEWIGAESAKGEALRSHKKGLMQQLFPRPGESRPRLRFSEFHNAGEWEEKELRNVLSSITSGLTIDQTSDRSGLRVTRIETISDSSIDLERVGYITTAEDVSAYRLAIGDILISNINSVAHIGKSVIVDADYDLYHGMNLLRHCLRTQHEGIAG